MTILNIFVEPDRADIWTDGAFCDPDWTVRAFASKSFILGAVPAVIAVCGPGNLGIAVHLALHDSFTSFDQMEDGLIEYLRSIPEFQEPSIAFILVWAGYSEKHGKVRGFATSPNGAIPGLKPWERGEVQRWLMPNPRPLVPELKRLGIDVMAKEPVSSADAHRIATQQRAWPGLVPGYPEAGAIGGFLQHTMVLETGIYTSVVHRWPDRIGEHITPSA